MRESFGARLRRRREEQGIDLVAIAEQTKIKRSLLEAVERDDVSHWPSGIFRRAYIRAYGQAIGLNPDVVVREFLEAHPEPAEVVTTAELASVIDGARTNAGPPTRLRYIVGSALGSLSRLRRSPAVEDLVISEGGFVDLSSPSEPDLPIAELTTAPEPAPVHAPDPAVVVLDEAETTNLVEAAPLPALEPASPDPDFLAVAQLCTDLGRVENPSEVKLLLGEAARILDATGLIVWIWDGSAPGLRPALSSGYSDRVLAQLPTVKREADNATAAAFRSGETCVINGGAHGSGALVVPLLAAEGCAGVLALELPHGREQATSTLAAATILAALLAQLVDRPRSAEVRPTAERLVPTVDLTPPLLRTAASR